MTLTKPNAAIGVAAAMPAGYASAPSATNTDIDSVITTNTTEISISVKNGVATLSGYVSCAEEASFAASQMASIEGVNQIFNLISTN